MADADGTHRPSLEPLEFQGRNTVRRSSMQSVHDQLAAVALMKAADGVGDDATKADLRKSITGVSGEGGLTFTEVVQNFVIACIGCAICVMPKKMDDAGWIPALPLLAIGCICCSVCGGFLADACSLAEKRSGNKVADYETLAFEGGGANMKALLGVTKNGAMLGFVLMFISFVIDAIASYVPPGFRKSHPETKTVIRFSIVMPLFILLSFIKDLKQLARFNTLGVAMVGFEVSGLMIGGVMHRFYGTRCIDKAEALAAAARAMDPNDVAENTCIRYEAFPDEGTAMNRLGSYMATCVFCFAILSTIPSVRSQMAQKDQMPKALSTSLAMVAVMYSIVMCLGYIGYGEGVHDNLAEALSLDSPIIGAITNTAILLNVLVSAPLILYCINNSFENTGTDAIRTPFTTPNMIFRACIVITLCVLGWCFTNIGAVISLISSAFCVMNNIFLPILLFYLLRDSTTPRSTPMSILSIAIVVVGILTAVFGVKGSLKAFMPNKVQPLNITGVNITTS